MSKEVSQVFGGIGDAVSGVLKGVGDVVDGAVKGVGSLAKQIYDSDVGKAIIIAGAIYFGGAALAGGFGGSAAGGSFFTGMGAGVSSAAGAMADAWTASSWGPLTEAWSTAADAGFATVPGAVGPGIPLTEAGSALMDAGGGEAAGTTFSGGGGVGGPVYEGVGSSAASGGGVAPAASTVGTNAATTALDNQIANSYINPLAKTAAPGTSWYSNPLVQYGAIQAGTQVAGGLIAGAGQSKAAQDQRDYEAEQLKKAQDLRNANMSGQLWSPDQAVAYAPTVAPAPAGLARRYMPQSNVAGSRFSQAYANLPPGMGLGQFVMRG